MAGATIRKRIGMDTHAVSPQASWSCQYVKAQNMAMAP